MLVVVVQDAEVGCYTPGECKDSNFLDFAPLPTPEDCHQLCIITDECNFFTHYGEDSEQDFGCFAYINCPVFTDLECTDCISGEVECPVEGVVRREYNFVFPKKRTIVGHNYQSCILYFLQCELPGRCQGVEVDFVTNIVTPGEPTPITKSINDKVIRFFSRGVCSALLLQPTVRLVVTRHRVQQLHPDRGLRDEGGGLRNLRLRAVGLRHHRPRVR